MQWGKDAIQGFINGIKSMIGEVGNAAKNVGEKIKSFLHFSRPDEGPLREYEKWMPDMIKGLSSTMTKSAPKLYSASKELAEKVAQGFNVTEAYNNLKDAVNLENEKLSTSLTANQVIKVEKEDKQQVTLQSIDDNKEHTTNVTVKLDGKVLTRVVNKENQNRKLQYG